MNDARNFNILNWYSFKRDSKILEVIFDRSFISFNHKIITIHDIKSVKEQYDYVILIDVLQHASSYYSKDPYEQLLADVKKLLKVDGHLLLAINNRFGLRYFAGFPEEDTNVPFEGILGYKNDSSIKTFTKSELNSIISIFKHRIYYYPYPNYLYPEEILTDNTVNRINPSSINNPLKFNINTVFDEKEVNKEFMINNIAGYFANSFLIDLCDKPVKLQADYIKISSNRNTRYSICTELLCKKGIVVKKMIGDVDQNHLIKMEKNSWQSGILKTIKYKWNKDKLECKLLECDCLSNKLDEYIDKNDLKTFWSLLSTFKMNLYTSPLTNAVFNDEFVTIFGSREVKDKLRWAKSGNADLKTDNIFIESKKWHVIDNEWVFNIPMPEEYMLWYSLDYYFGTNKKCSKLFSYGDLLRFVEIDEETLSIFNEWKKHFIYDYVGTVDINYKANDIIDLLEINKLYKEVSSAKQIMNSKFWKISEPVRKILDRLKGK